MRQGFDNEKYLTMQSEHIMKRVNQFKDKLYLEFGGKLFDDYHASRVLPGFEPDSKMKMLLELKEQAEIVIAINANHIEENKVRGDLGITYDMDVLRLIDVFVNLGFELGSVVITHYKNQTAADYFSTRLKKMGIIVYHHYVIEGYPNNTDLILSDEGYGKNEYIKTSRPLVVVTAPGPGSGKMATCMSQLYADHKNGLDSGYAKFETFPIWNLPLNHPVNIAYEAATADLDDVNMIDPFHLEAYGVTTVNYNRDVEIFPVLKTIFTQIFGYSPYKSPTDMGVNMAGNCIKDNAACEEAAKQEIIRRYYHCTEDILLGKADEKISYKMKLLMNQVGVKPEDRKVVSVANDLAKAKQLPAAALELPNGKIVTGKTGNLLGACAALLLNALKELAGVDHETDVISPKAIEPIQKLKVDYLGGTNPRLHMDEILIALSMSAKDDENAKKSLDMVPNLRGCQAHVSVMLSHVDIKYFKKLGIQYTCEAHYENNNLYH